MKRRNVLGKGLNSLLPDEAISSSHDGNATGRPYFLCSLDSIEPNNYQPRQVMDDEALNQLADSIREKGILQPLIVRKRSEGGGYALIAGERRWRAARIAGLTDVPVLLKDVSESDRLELALIENIQRQNLNPVEEAEAYQRLTKEFGLTQEEVARKVSKDRSTVTNLIRLLQLPLGIKMDLSEGRLSMGHARLLLSINDEQAMLKVRDEIIQKGLSVRQTEALVKSHKSNNSPKLKSKINALPSSYCTSLANDLVRYFGTKSRIVQNGSRGKVEIEYYSADDLERLLELLLHNRNKGPDQ